MVDQDTAQWASQSIVTGFSVFEVEAKLRAFCDWFTQEEDLLHREVQLGRAETVREVLQTQMNRLDTRFVCSVSLEDGCVRITLQGPTEQESRIAAKALALSLPHTERWFLSIKEAGTSKRTDLFRSESESGILESERLGSCGL